MDVVRSVDLRDDLNEALDMVGRLREENSSLKDQIEHLQQCLESSEQEKRSYAEETVQNTRAAKLKIAELTVQLTNSREQNDTSRRTITTLKIALEKEKQRVTCLDADLRTAEDTQSMVKQGHKDIVRELKHAVDEANRERDSYIMKLNMQETTHNKEKAWLQDSIRGLKASNAEGKVALGNADSTHRREVQDLQQKFVELNEAAKLYKLKQETIKEKLRAKISRKQEDYNNLKKDCDALASTIQCWKKKFSHLKNKTVQFRRMITLDDVSSTQINA
eukprot:m.44124 g.44124  ORF g.44124 m.44124 type:complete len:277 (+) comp7148_c0_seq1:80-910(+)